MTKCKFANESAWWLFCLEGLFNLATTMGI